MHQVSGRSGLGVSLALLTALLWGVLPIALKVALQELDPYTACWVRLSVSALLISVFMRGRSVTREELRFPWAWPLILLCGLAASGLILNYIFYNFSLHRLNPESAQLLIQVAPFLMMVGGVLIYREPFSRRQILGACVLVIGLLVFFNKNLLLLFQGSVNSVSGYGLGVTFMLISSVAWAVYALVQKKLLKVMSSMQIMLMIYLVGTLVLLPMAKPADVLLMSPLPLGMLIFCCLNTVVSYGAFSEAMNHIHASRVSSIVTVVPVFTFAVMSLLVAFWPEHFEAESLGGLAYFGAVLVVLGSALASVGGRKKPVVE